MAKTRSVGALPNVRRLFVFDLEATCGDDVPKDETEIIEIGGVLVDMANYETAAEFQLFVCPVRHPNLTDFCTELTSIEQKDVNDAPTYAEAAGYLERFFDKYSVRACGSWGDYDLRQIKKDSKFHSVKNPLPRKHVNLKDLFGRKWGRRRAPGLEMALRHLHMELEGQHHRAIDDARNIIRLLPFIAKQ